MTHRNPALFLHDINREKIQIRDRPGEILKQRYVCELGHENNWEQEILK